MAMRYRRVCGWGDLTIAPGIVGEEGRLVLAAPGGRGDRSWGWGACLWGRRGDRAGGRRRAGSTT